VLAWILLSMMEDVSYKLLCKTLELTQIRYR
jgi:hypothetical protein